MSLQELRNHFELLSSMLKDSSRSEKTQGGKKAKSMEEGQCILPTLGMWALCSWLFVGIPIGLGVLKIHARG